MALLYWLLSGTSFGQTRNDSTSTGHLIEHITPGKAGIDSIRRSLIQETDSLDQGFENKLSRADSIQDKLLYDNAVSHSVERIDSIHSSFYQRSESVENAYKKKLTRIDSSQTVLHKKLDSLTTLNLPTNKVLQRLDSLTTLRENTVGNFEKKIQSIKDSTSL